MSAIISACGTYRYRLERRLRPGGTVFAYLGVNPSTADAEIDDATVRKWRGFAEVNDASAFIVGNLFAYRATDVRELLAADDPIGPDNASHLRRIINEADILVPCWGAIAKIPKPYRARAASVLGMLLTSGKPVKILGWTACGQPKHPLMLAYATPLRIIFGPRD